MNVYAQYSAALAQTPDWVEGLIFLAIVVLSAIGSLGKWIVQKMQERRERQEGQRRALTLDETPPVRPYPPIRQPVPREKRTAAPPTAAPVGRPLEGPPASPQHPPILERVFEVLVEQATGQKIDRGKSSNRPARRTMPPPAPPPTPDRPTSGRRRDVAPGASAPSPRTSDRTQTRRSEKVSHPGERRERLLTEDTMSRLGSVETHVPPTSIEEAGFSPIDVHHTFDDSNALRRAIVLAEILSPPLALRTDLDKLPAPSAGCR